ncbi:MAG TPA: hypothetical protein VHE60_02800 [Pyrinomonadaceae bacterium]|nr:hypothetical protein [Pyrinomonadaceae bacterium]
MSNASGLDYLKKNCSSRDRILLVNPPVIESRYQWVRWNQPLDLLKLSTLLKMQFDCDAKLYDFMLPVNNKVLRTANKPDSKIVANGHAFSLWRYGNSEADFSKWLDKVTASWRPTQIWITSLTSYWWKGIANTIARLKNRYSDIPIMLYGRYPQLENAHAALHSFADVLITDEFDLCDYSADFDLYENQKPSFCALDVRSQTWVQEAAEQFADGVANFVFFNDPLVSNRDDFCEQMASFLRLNLKSKTNLRPRLYALCGLYPSAFTRKVAEMMHQVGFVELHFEYETERENLDLDSYRQVKESFEKVGYDLQPDQVSGFVYIGLPSDNLERIIKHTLNLFEVFGSVILKPWTPMPGSQLYETHKDQIETDRIELLSPHVFPFSAVNGITAKEYEELYVLVAALNQKVRSRAFDSFPGTLAYEMISRSLDKKVWSLPA